MNVFARKLFSQVLVSWGRVMRYGTCNSRAPALLAGGVVAGPQGRPLVTPSCLADASSPLHLAAVGRAVPLPTVAARADDHQPVAPRAVEHPVALLDDWAPATEGWTQRPPPAILSFNAVLSLWRWHRSPGRYANDLGFVFSVEALFYRPDGGLATRLSLTPAIDDICGMRLEEPDPLSGLGGWGEPDPGENQIHEACAGGRKPHPRLMPEREPEPAHRRKTALLNRR